jgi:iron-sulfur cluster assembly protein
MHVSETAAQAINAALSEVPEGGLRISPAAANGDQVMLQVSVVESPADTDQIIQEQGTRVFVDCQVAPLLEDKTLDAHIAEDRGVEFAIV